MFINNLKFSIRNLFRNKTYTLINIFGLSFGISAFILLFLYSRNELTYDAFHVNIKNIYHIAEKHDRKNAKADIWRLTRGPVLPKILEDYPDVLNGTRVQGNGFKVFYNDKSSWKDFILVDSGFFSIFTFKPVAGSLDHVFNNPNAAVITQKKAHEIFGDENPIGKQLVFNDRKSNFVIAAVIADIPANSTINFDMVAYYPYIEKVFGGGNDPNAWYNVNHSAFISLKPGVDPHRLEEKFPPMVNKNFLTGDEPKPRLLLLPFATEHMEESGNKSFILILIAIAIGVLVIATINFVNLSNVRSLSRAKEIGVRKVLGAEKKLLVSQFLIESFIISLVALSLGIALAELLLPQFNHMFQTKLELDFVTNPRTLLVLMGVWIFCALAAGAIPALYLSHFSPITSMRGMTKNGKVNMSLQNSLVILQFALAVMLISSTVIIWRQISFMRNQDLHFDQENVVTINTNIYDNDNPNAGKRKIKLVMDELSQDPRIISCSGSFELPGRYNSNYNMFYPENMKGKDGLHLRQAYVGAGYFKTYGIELIEGRDFSEVSRKDSMSVIINESVRKLMGSKSALDSYIHQSASNGSTYRVIGVVKDFHYQGLQSNIEPLLHFYADTSWGYRYLSVRAQKGQMNNVIQLIKDKWQQVEPKGTADYFFPKDEINKQYAMYEHIRTVTGYFAIVAIIISCLGLFALAMYMTTRRTKEIGIRKVLGASVLKILNVLVKQIVLMVILASIVGCILAFFGMQKFLLDFAFKAPLNWWIFGIAALTALLIALVTVSWQAYKASMQNPVEALRYE